MADFSVSVWPKYWNPASRTRASLVSAIEARLAASGITFSEVTLDNSELDELGNVRKINLTVHDASSVRAIPHDEIAAQLGERVSG